MFCLTSLLSLLLWEMAATGSLSLVAAAVSDGPLNIDQPTDGFANDEERNRFHNRIPTEEEWRKWTSYEHLWGKSPQILHRFPKCPPGVLWKVLKDNYVANSNSQHDLYHIDGDVKTRLHMRAPENDRDEFSLRQDYKRSIKAFGFTEEGRSNFVLFPFAGRARKEMRHIMAAAHII